MRILVTGGSGKIGRYVLRELASAKHELLNVDRNFMPPGEPRLCRSVVADLNDAGQAYDAIAQFRPEAVCHLASNPNPVNFPRQDIFFTNVRCCYNMLQAAGDLGVIRFVQASSIMANGYFNSGILPPKLPITEEDQIPAGNAYAMSKQVSETICDGMVARYPKMTIVSLRPTYVMLPDQYGELKRRRDLGLAMGSDNLWSYIDVRDVAGAFRAAAEGSSEGHQIFQIAARDHAWDIPITHAAGRFLKSTPKLDPSWDETNSPMDCSKISRAFGWTPKYSWRDELLV